MSTMRGITFIESLIWVAVFMIAMMALIVSLLSFYRANVYTLEQAQAVSDARRSVEGLVQTIREADYSGQGAYPLVAIATSSVTFYADVDQDPHTERVRYFLDGSSLKRGIVDPVGDPPAYTAAEEVTTVSPYIRNVLQQVDMFHFYDAAGAEVTNMTQVTDVRFVRMDIIVNVSPDRLPNELTVRSSATLRNITHEL